MRQRQTRTFQRWLFAGVVLFFSLSRAISTTVSMSFEQANRLYEQGNFADAAGIYENILKNGRSPNIYFNLGNAYLKNGQLGRAIFNYRMAESFVPRDPDIQANLRLARERVAGTNSVNEPGWERLFLYFTLNELTAFSALLFWLWTALVCLQRLRPKLGSRLRGPAILIGGALGVTLILLITAWLITRAKVAIVATTGKITVHLGPMTESQASFTAEAGTELDLLARREEWLQVRDQMNRSGWIQATNVLVFPPVS